MDPQFQHRDAGDEASREEQDGSYYREIDRIHQHHSHRRETLARHGATFDRFFRPAIEPES